MRRQRSAIPPRVGVVGQLERDRGVLFHQRMLVPSRSPDLWKISNSSVVDLQNSELSEEVQLNHPDYLDGVRRVPNVRLLLDAARSHVRAAWR